MESPFKARALTEEQISQVTDFFDGKSTDISESKAYLLYGKMRHNGIRIDKAEQEIEKTEKRKRESYRWKIEQEINDKSKDYKIKNLGDYPKFDLVSVKEWEDGRTVEIGVEGNYDMEKRKQTRTHTILIEERMNPDYFQEIVKRFNLIIE